MRSQDTPLGIDDAVQFRFEPGTGGVIRQFKNVSGRQWAMVATREGLREVPVDALRRVRPEHEARTRARANNVDGQPHWPDACHHDRPRDRFLGSFTAGGKAYDVYIYQDNALSSPPDMHLCIRYGREDAQYISPGNVESFVERFQGKTESPEEYRLALDIIMRFQRESRT